MNNDKWEQEIIHEYCQEAHLMYISGSNLSNHEKMKRAYIARAKKDKTEIENLKSIIERGDEIRNNWENNEYQEASHYNWLDDENRRVEHENFNLKEEIAKRDKLLEQASEIINHNILCFWNADDVTANAFDTDKQWLKDFNDLKKEGK